MPDIVTRRFIDDEYLLPAKSFVQLRLALSPTVQSISRPSQVPTPHLSSHPKASWHLALIIGLEISSITELTFKIYLITSLSAPRDGITIQGRDPEAWLATQS